MIVYIIDNIYDRLDCGRVYSAHLERKPIDKHTAALSSWVHCLLRAWPTPIRALDSHIALLKTDLLVYHLNTYFAPASQLGRTCSSSATTFHPSHKWPMCPFANRNKSVHFHIRSGLFKPDSCNNCEGMDKWRWVPGTASDAMQQGRIKRESSQEWQGPHWDQIAPALYIDGGKNLFCWTLNTYRDGWAYHGALGMVEQSDLEASMFQSERTRVVIYLLRGKAPRWMTNCPPCQGAGKEGQTKQWIALYIYNKEFR